MGVTKDWMVTTEGQRNWADACEREALRRFDWNKNWGWMPAVIQETNQQLRQLKEKQIARIRSAETGNKAVLKDYRPIPETTNHEYGWLVTKPDFTIERFGPFPLTMKVHISPDWEQVHEEIAKQDLERLKRTREKKKQEKLRRLMEKNEETGIDTKERQSDDADGGNTPEESVDGKTIEIRDDPGAQSTQTKDVEAEKAPRKCGNTVLDEGGKRRACCCTANCWCLRQ